MVISSVPQDAPADFCKVFNAGVQLGRGPRFWGAMRQCFQEVLHGKFVPLDGQVGHQMLLWIRRAEGAS